MYNFKSLQKTIFVVLSAAVILFSIISTPLQASAATQEQIPPAPLFCAGINIFGNRLLDRVNSTAGKQIVVGSESTQRQTEFANTLTQKRAQWDKDRNSQYQAMLAKASNDSQRVAIEKFKTTTEEAVATRRKSVDVAVDEYFTAYNSQIQAQNSQLGNARSQFVGSVSSAIDTAKRACDSNQNPAVIRQNLQTNLKLAKEDLQSSKQSLNNLKSELASIRKTEIKSIDQVLSEFNSTLLRARQTFINDIKGSGASDTQFDI